MRINEIKEELKIANPTLRRGSEEDGYVEIVGEEYEAIIQSWAETTYAKELEAAELARIESNKAAAGAKLAALGLTSDDLKALGLG